jgi:hypothetical protein
MKYLCVMKMKMEYTKVIFGISVFIFLLLFIVINNEFVSKYQIIKAPFFQPHCNFIDNSLLFYCFSIVISLIFCCYFGRFLGVFNRGRRWNCQHRDAERTEKHGEDAKRIGRCCVRDSSGKPRLRIKLRQAKPYLEGGLAANSPTACSSAGTPKSTKDKKTQLGEIASQSLAMPGLLITNY